MASRAIPGSELLAQLAFSIRLAGKDACAPLDRAIPRLDLHSSEFL